MLASSRAQLPIAIMCCFVGIWVNVECGSCGLCEWGGVGCSCLLPLCAVLWGVGVNVKVVVECGSGVG